MPLIDLQTNLTNLRFGNDRPGYGSSGLPYIQTRIPGVPNATGTSNPIFRIQSTGNLDYPIRGGDLNFNLGTQTYTLSSQIDKTRIKRFFEDAPRGTAFIQKQIGLQLSNPKMETGNTLFGIGQAVPLPGLLENTRVYNKGANTLAQVGVMGSGAHAMRHGLIPFNPWQKQYYSIVNQQNISNGPAGSSQNRLVILSRLKMTQSTNPIVNKNNVIDIEKVNTLGISLNKNILFQYLGGPGSVYGVGSTTIQRVVDTTKLRSTTTMTYELLQSQKAQKQSGTGKYEISDFRSAVNSNISGSNLPIWEKQKSIEYRFFTSESIDRLNAASFFNFTNDQAPWETSYNDDGTYSDLIKFVFEAIDNDITSRSRAIFFRAFLTAGITDNNSAQLNSFKYIGRGDNFYVYQGFERSISFSFRIAAGSREELMPLFRKLNLLIGQVYPDYSDKGIMRAPLTRVTIGDYLHRVPGFIENVNVTVDNGTPWEINLYDVPYNGLDSQFAQLPQVVDVSISFKPIMDTLQNRYGTAIVNNPSDITKSKDLQEPVYLQRTRVADLSVNSLNTLGKIKTPDFKNILKK